MEQLNLDHMLTNSLDHLFVHSIVLRTRVGSEKANNIMPELRTSRALLRLLSDWNFYSRIFAERMWSSRNPSPLFILRSHSHRRYQSRHVDLRNVRRSNAATLRILGNMQ